MFDITGSDRVGHKPVCLHLHLNSDDHNLPETQEKRRKTLSSFTHWSLQWCSTDYTGLESKLKRGCPKTNIFTSIVFCFVFLALDVSIQVGKFWNEKKPWKSTIRHIKYRKPVWSSMMHLLYIGLNESWRKLWYHRICSYPFLSLILPPHLTVTVCQSTTTQWWKVT